MSIQCVRDRTKYQRCCETGKTIRSETHDKNFIILRVGKDTFCESLQSEQFYGCDDFFVYYKIEEFESAFHTLWRISEDYRSFAPINYSTIRLLRSYIFVLN